MTVVVVNNLCAFGIMKMMMGGWGGVWVCG